MKKMTGGQLTQIYNIATQQGCGEDKVQFLIEEGYLADFFGGKWNEVNRTDFRKLAKLAPEDFGVKPDFKVWKTIKLGTGLKKASDFENAICGIGFKFNEWAYSIFSSFEKRGGFKVNENEIEVDLVLVPSEKLITLGYGSSRSDMYLEVEKLGLKPCPEEVGPQLRLQYRDQPVGEHLLVGSEGSPGVFTVSHPKQVLLPRSGTVVIEQVMDLSGTYGNGGREDNFFCNGDKWVFMKPRK